MDRIAVLITCHNRREKTIKSIHALRSSHLAEGLVLDLIIVDDGSTDGTGEAIRRSFPNAKVLQGNGSLYWNRGMHLAFEYALERKYDAYLWLNDDTFLFPNAVQRLIDCSSSLSRRVGRPCVIVGSTQNGAGRLSYGGSVRKSALRRFKFHKVWSDAHPVMCEVMNGNVVLIPGEIAERVGSLDPTFEHAMGDIDYALRVRKKGFDIYVMPGFAGVCKNNPIRGGYMDNSLPLSERWKLMRRPTGLTISSWLHFTRQHGGVAWPIYFVSPYLKQVLLNLKIFR